MSLDLKGKQIEFLRDAIVSAYPGYEQLKEMLRFDLDERLSSIAAPDGMAIVVLKVIDWAESQGRLEDLISGAIRRVPRNPQLQQVAVELSLTSSEEPVRKGDFEAIVLQNSPFNDVVEWREQMSSIERRICRIDINGNGIGTGFLVGKDVVLTNCHVADEFKFPAQVKARFDYKTNRSGITEEGKVYSLAENYLIDKSDRNDLDFALLRLSEPAGEEVIAPDAGTTRGWLSPKSHNFQVNEIELILQHPMENPLKISAGAVSKVDNHNNRVVYTANTMPGSSGSPVFTLGWDLVAIHHFGKDTGNIGIPLQAIWQRLGDKNELGELNQ